jgi:hypothetical protein
MILLRKKIFIISLIALMSCEDQNDDGTDDGSLVGTWELSNMGDYANADCSGDIDDTGWSLASAFGLKATMEFASNGKGIYTLSFMGESQEVAMTWNSNSSQICMYETQCFNYKINGSNKFILDTLSDANCEDDNGNETNHNDQSSCESAGNMWNPPSCQMQEYTKK